MEYTLNKSSPSKRSKVVILFNERKLENILETLNPGKRVSDKNL